ncbi:MAG: permease [Desulfuromonadia bacterium]
MAGRETPLPHHCEIHTPGARMANRSLLLLIAVSLILLAISLLGGPEGRVGFPSRFLTSLADVVVGPRGMIPELIQIFPYILAGSLIAGYIRTRKLALKLKARLRRHGGASVLLATVVGLISPLCACGTVTTAVGLLFAGVTVAPVMALMVTSPLMSPSTYLITLNDLGPEWTIIRTLAAFLLGIGTGFGTLLLCRAGLDRGGIFRDGSIVRGDLHSEDYPDGRLRCNCRERFGNRVASRTGNPFLVFLAKSAETMGTVGKYVLIGLFVGAVIERSIPSGFLFRFFGGEEPLNVIWVTLASVPLFLHQISASSIISHIHETIPGVLDARAVLAFMIGGPVTAIPTMAIFLSLLKPRYFTLYLVSCVLGTIGIAYLFGLLFFVPGVEFGAPLFRGVSSLPGGGTLFSRTGEDRSSRMILQGRGGGLVWVSTDDRSGRGGVVIDGNRARLLTLGDPDVQRYILNIAQTLEDHQVKAPRPSILILSPDGKSAGSIISLLQRAGYRAQERRIDLWSRGEGVSQLWIFPDRSFILSPPIRERIGVFRDGGGSLLIAPDGVNDSVVPLLRQVGVTPMGEERDNGKRLISQKGDLLSPLYRLLPLFEQLKGGSTTEGG